MPNFEPERCLFLSRILHLQSSSEVNQEACLCCGAPLVQSRSRTRRYCSDRCRVRAYYQRQTNAKLPSHGVKASPARSSEVRRDTCLCCGIAIGQSIGGRRTRHYCSDRCRARAYHQRQAKLLTTPLAPVSQRVNVSPTRSSEVSRDTCLCCGTAIEQSGGRRTRQYCSDRCRVRAFHQRQANTKPLTAPLAPVSHGVNASAARSSEVSQEACPYAPT